MLSRAVGFGAGKRGKLFERSEFLPRRVQILPTGVVSAARLPFLLVLFFGQAKKRMLLPQGDKRWGLTRSSQIRNANLCWSGKRYCCLPD